VYREGNDMLSKKKETTKIMIQYDFMIYSASQNYPDTLHYGAFLHFEHRKHSTRHCFSTLVYYK
jgi:hypothetical protein